MTLKLKTLMTLFKEIMSKMIFLSLVPFARSKVLLAEKHLTQLPKQNFKKWKMMMQ